MSFQKLPLDLIRVIERYLPFAQDISDRTGYLEFRPGRRGYEANLPPEFMERFVSQLETFQPRPRVDRSDYVGSVRVTPHRFLATVLSIDVHLDPCWNFIVFLNDVDRHGGGTGFFRHRKTGLCGLHDRSAVEATLRSMGWSRKELARTLCADRFRAEAWVEIQRIESRFNRLAAFDGLLFHSHVPPETTWSETDDLRVTLNAAVPLEEGGADRDSMLQLLERIREPEQSDL